MSTHLPLRIPRSSYRQCLLRARNLHTSNPRQPSQLLASSASTPLPRTLLRPQWQPTCVRTFSSTVSWNKEKGRVDPTTVRVMAEKEKGESPEAMQARLKVERGMGLMEDMGVFNGMFIHAHNRDLPGFSEGMLERLKSGKIGKMIFFWWGPRMRYEGQWLFRKVQDFAGRVSYKMFTNKELRFRQRFRGVIMSRKQVKKEAEELYINLYKDLAAGGNALHEHALPSLISSLRSHIAARHPKEHHEWELLKHISRPRVVANRASPLPGDYESSGVRQVAVQFHTRQRLTIRTKTTAEEQPSSGWQPGAHLAREAVKQEATNGVFEKDVKEIIVVQRRMLKGVEEDWKIIAFVEPSDVEAWEADVQRQVEEQEYERKWKAQQSAV